MEEGGECIVRQRKWYVQRLWDREHASDVLNMCHISKEKCNKHTLKKTQPLRGNFKCKYFVCLLTQVLERFQEKFLSISLNTVNLIHHSVCSSINFFRHTNGALRQ